VKSDGSCVETLHTSTLARNSVLLFQEARATQLAREERVEHPGGLVVAPRHQLPV